MGIFSYLTTPDPAFGPLAWTFFIIQILGVGAGAYLTFRHTERNPARQTFMRQLGIALMILGGVGVLIGALRLLNVPVFNQRIWFWIQALIEASVAGYVVYYMRSVLPGLERAAVARGRGARPTPKVTTGDTSAEAPRPVATTGRREARRERKRKSR
ncbi:MAG: hypothetical protein RMK84_13140 [Oscillochloridaceae bacterium]|nr:hypothetical protein [Chloroflexaceae bacterium]MDW8391065.1 hypothetical protein [Oscillochloridaceae bacterium]